MAFKIRESTDPQEFTVMFGDLEHGDWYLDSDGDVCRRNGDEDATAILSDGCLFESSPGEKSPVTPIDVEIVWRRKTPST